MLKGYIKKPQGNAKITEIPAGQMVLSAGCDNHLWYEAINQSGRIARRLLVKTKQFLLFSLKTPGFCLHLLQDEEAMENSQRSFPAYSLSNHTTFSRTQMAQQFRTDI
jgi:hypothetical protein